MGGQHKHQIRGHCSLLECLWSLNLVLSPGLALTEQAYVPRGRVPHTARCPNPLHSLSAWLALAHVCPTVCSFACVPNVHSRALVFVCCVFVILYLPGVRRE